MCSINFSNNLYYSRWLICCFQTLIQIVLLAVYFQRCWRAFLLSFKLKAICWLSVFLKCLFSYYKSKWWFYSFCFQIVKLLRTTFLWSLMWYANKMDFHQNLWYLILNSSFCSITSSFCAVFTNQVSTILLFQTISTKLTKTYGIN